MSSEWLLRVADAAEYAARWAQSAVAGKPYNFSWFETSLIAASGLPATRKGMVWALRQGVAAVLSLTEKLPKPVRLVAGPVPVLHLPMRNRMPAPPSELAAAVGFMARQLADGRPVLVHCLSGRGRTGMVLAAYLVRFKGYGAPEAIEEVRRQRPGSLKNKRQVDAVIEFEEVVRRVDQGWRSKQ